MPELIRERLLNTLKFIQKFIDENRMAPTIKEIAEAVEIAEPSALAQVLRLENAGYIKRTPKQWRSIQMVQAPPFSRLPIREMMQIPIVGRVAAGSPLLAESNVQGHVDVDPLFVRSGGTLFALKVKGDSMTGVGIQENDFIIVRQQPAADSGEIVVALLGEEGTVKRLRIENDRIELLPENPRHKPIKVEQGDDFRIVGKVLAVYRRALMSTQKQRG